MRKRSWGWRLAAIIAGVALVLGLAACGDDDDDETATDGAAAELTLRLGYVTPAAHPYGIAVDYFVEQVAEESGGAIQIETLPNYTGGDVPLLQDVRGGAVDMASVSSAVWATQGVTAFDALQAAFLIDRYDLLREVITGPIGQEMLESTAQVGLVGLAIHEGGLRHPLGARKAFLNPGDFRGTTIRTPEAPVLEAGIRSLGANPEAVPIPDVYAALRDGTVDGMEANLGLIETFRFFEVARFVTENVIFWPFPTALVMNQARFDALSEDQQNAIRTAAERVPGFSIDIFEQPSELPQRLCDEGIRYATASEEDVAALREASQSAIERISQDEVTAGFIAQIQEVKDGLGEAPDVMEVPEGCAVGSG